MLSKILFDAAKDNGGGSEEGSNWEAVLSELPAEKQELYQKHVSGLLNSVKATRAERDDLAKQIRDLSAKQEKGSDTQKELEQLSSELEAAAERAVIAEKRVKFAEEAARPEIGCVNARAAWLVAVAEDAFTKQGDPDWDKIRKAAPQLFAIKASRSNAGNGTKDEHKSVSMNDYIRRSAGR